jgi:hypothetical protein
METCAFAKSVVLFYTSRNVESIPGFFQSVLTAVISYKLPFHHFMFLLAKDAVSRRN